MTTTNLQTSVTVIPFYGRDYKSKAAVLEAWNADKDFTIQGFGGHGRAINKSDAENPEYGVHSVSVRYDRNTKLAVIPVVH